MTAEYLNECFMYMPKTGNAYWRVRPDSHFANHRRAHVWNKRYAGIQAGWLEEKRYRYVVIDGKRVGFNKVLKQLQGYAKSVHLTIPRGYYFTGRGSPIYSPGYDGPQR